MQRQLTTIPPLTRVFHFFLVSTWITLPRKAQTITGSWTLAALTDLSSLPPAVRLKHNEENVYFAELVQSQLKPDGKGLGTFLWNRTVSDVDEPTTPSMEGLSEGLLLKYVDRG